ncbi:MAG: hypothetical protein JWR71_1321 [Pseudarthrobacter sp.]|nr:hypothetical protein [Pseudarthrobacter sp.]
MPTSPEESSPGARCATRTCTSLWAPSPLWTASGKPSPLPLTAPDVETPGSCQPPPDSLQPSWPDRAPTMTCCMWVPSTSTAGNLCPQRTLTREAHALRPPPNRGPRTSWGPIFEHGYCGAGAASKWKFRTSFSPKQMPYSPRRDDRIPRPLSTSAGTGGQPSSAAVPAAGAIASLARALRRREIWMAMAVGMTAKAAIRIQGRSRT